MPWKIIPIEDDHWTSRQGSILPYDKLEHFLIALAVSAGLCFFDVDPFVSFLATFGLGLGYEVFHDGFRSGLSVIDIVANTLGAGAGVFGYIIFT